MVQFDAREILGRLAELREGDAPTHGGRVLSYVYDSGVPEIDLLAADAIRMVQPVNGLDPTTFTSVAVMERDLIAFARGLLRGGEGIVGSVTTGGTESCLLAVKTARDAWRAAGGQGRPRLVAPTTVHAAFQKAAHYFDLVLDLVPVDVASGRVEADRIAQRLGSDVALVVVSAPSYPFASLDPVEAVAAQCDDVGIACHVDACIGGLILPFWSTGDGEAVPPWDFSVRGVTSISADLHKFGYAPKGASVLLHRDRDRQRLQYFATTSWPGYPVVNPTILGSKSAGALAASWAIVEALGADGFAELAQSCLRATRALVDIVGDIEGLRVMGDPVGPLLAVAADTSVPAESRVDPHHWADQARARGWLLQLQPGLEQADGTRLPHTTHLTVTPVTLERIDELEAVLRASAAEVRGVAAVAPADLLATLPADLLAGLAGGDASLDSEAALQVLRQIGLVGVEAGAGAASARLPERMAPFLALIETLPHALTERLLIELLARIVEPR
ncbi:aspartate aminotransferase family protein [Diaminobutyricibacter tongyongensis]|uniref:Aspartate aminotransferase family protein n=1 Tax=Leifsonia tongyongensis TaxID=1268043 RepID=A0A6L9XZM8_9MICO|nr:aspartate aminotransferase family protein [Diaminobutyricibacter tongyongensis]NEN06851.1 aspartate aminotransferase family protein [Diaminobutyricibacter tongyongensis]